MKTKGGVLLKSKIICIGSFLLSLIILPLAAQENREYDLKAAFIFNFSQYIEWQDNHTDTLYVAVLGSSPITSKLRVIGSEHLFGKRILNVKEYQNPGDALKCHILFIPANSTSTPEQLSDQFADSHTVLIGEKPGVASKGYHINFIVVNNKLRFEVNMKPKNGSRIRFGSSILKHAILVNS